jgi:hypothetical protein
MTRCEKCSKLFAQLMQRFEGGACAFGAMIGGEQAQLYGGEAAVAHAYAFQQGDSALQ